MQVYLMEPLSQTCGESWDENLGLENCAACADLKQIMFQSQSLGAQYFEPEAHI